MIVDEIHDAFDLIVNNMTSKSFHFDNNIKGIIWSFLDPIGENKNIDESEIYVLYEIKTRKNWETDIKKIKIKYTKFLGNFITCVLHKYQSHCASNADWTRTLMPSMRKDVSFFQDDKMKEFSNSHMLYRIIYFNLFLNLVYEIHDFIRSQKFIGSDSSYCFSISYYNNYSSLNNALNAHLNNYIT